MKLFEGIEPDPSVETVMRGAEAMLKVRAGLDRGYRWRISDRCSEGYVDQIRISGYHIRRYVQGVWYPASFVRKRISARFPPLRVLQPK